jgi:amidophosphoribosyltransferase
MSSHVNVETILKRSLRDADGGYVMAGMIGHGDAFVVRDPNGIRPCFYYKNDEIVVITSEKQMTIDKNFFIFYGNVIRQK